MQICSESYSRKNKKKMVNPFFLQDVPKCESFLENCLPTPTRAISTQEVNQFHGYKWTILKRQVAKSSGLWKQHCEHLHQVHGLEGSPPQKSYGLESWRSAASGHASTHSLYMNTSLPPFKCVFSETGVRTHGISLGVNSGSHVVSRIFIYCFNYAYCNQPTRPKQRA